MECQEISSLSQVGPQQWDALVPEGHPAAQHGLLLALEKSGSLGAAMGQRPRYLVLREGGLLRAALILYEKNHSFGEYIFDWSWAQAAESLGLPYYPKLVSAIPYTPVPAPKFLMPTWDPKKAALLHQQALLRQRQDDLSSLHYLFTSEQQTQFLASQGMATRLSIQFHWKNRGFQSFEDFLGHLKKSKRKQIKKERRRVSELGLDFFTVEGADATPELLALMDDFYRRTCAKRGGHAYLGGGFFSWLHHLAPEAMLFTGAAQNGRTMALALHLKGRDRLFGRYWGQCPEAEGMDFLHFELCYYRAIDYAIEHALTAVEAGAQGEHKLLRGYDPVPIHSAHWIANPRLFQAMRRFLAQERQAYQRNILDHPELSAFKLE